MTTEVLVPTLPESVTDATVVGWHRNRGDAVQRDDNLVDLETDKVVLEVPAPTDGVLVRLMKKDGDIVNAGDVLAVIEEQDVATAVTTQPAASAQSPAPHGPAVRRLLAEHNLDGATITGTGKDGRLVKADVLGYLGAQDKPANAPSPPTASPVPAAPAPTPHITDVVGGRAEKRVSMTRLRARIAERLVQAQQNAAILSTFNEVNLKAVMDLRTQHKEAFLREHNVKLGLMSFFVKAAVQSLKDFPIVNASVDGTEIIYHGYFDIGIAVSSPRGLVVPILRDADQLSFAEIEAGIADFSVRASENKLDIEDLTGGTFTISNGGVFGSMLSTPILNPPQSAILGMHAILDRPVAVNGEVVIRPMMYLALSYDHRIVDGRDAVQFLVGIKQALEDPAKLLLDI